jgi:hypothetical protein
MWLKVKALGDFNAVPVARQVKMYVCKCNNKPIALG